MNVTIIPVGMLGTNCYLLASRAGSCALIDPGAQPEKITDILEEKEYTLRYILLTHGHWDHLGAVKKLMEKFPGVPCYIGAEDKELLTDPEKSSRMARAQDWETLHIPDAKELGDGDKLELDELTLEVIETPGHSKGSVCYLCENIIFSGDTLFLENCGRCDLYGGDFGVMKKSLKRLAGLSGEYTVYPGHGEATSLSHERAHNPYINHA